MTNQDQMFDDLAERMRRMQVKAREMAQKRIHLRHLARVRQGIGVWGKFQVSADIPEHMRVGMFQSGAVYDALVRFSNARGEILGDLSKDQRGSHPGEDGILPKASRRKTIRIFRIS